MAAVVGGAAAPGPRCGGPAEWKGSAAGASAGLWTASSYDGFGADSSQPVDGQVLHPRPLPTLPPPPPPSSPTPLLLSPPPAAPSSLPPVPLTLPLARRSTQRSSGVARPRRQRAAPPPWHPCALAAGPRARVPCSGLLLRRRRLARGGPSPRRRATARHRRLRRRRPPTPWAGITRTLRRRSRRCLRPPHPSPPLPPTAWVMPHTSLLAPASPGKTRSARSTCPPRRVSARPTCRRRPPPRQAHALRTPRSTAARPAAARRQARSARHVGDRVARARSGPRRVRRRPAPVCTDPQHLPQHLPHASRTSPADPLQTPCTPPALPRCIPPLRSCAPAAPLRRPYLCRLLGARAARVAFRRHAAPRLGRRRPSAPAAPR